MSFRFHQMKDAYNIYQHRTIEERIQAAEFLSSPMELGNAKLFIDPMDNNVTKLYAALPERLYILYEGTLAYTGGVGPFYYNLTEVETWLASFRKSRPSPVELLGNLRIDSRVQ